MRYGYVVRDANGIRRSKPQINFIPAALGGGDPQAVTDSGGDLFYVFNNMFADNDNFSTHFDIKREGLFHVYASVLLEWAVVPTTGDVSVQIRDDGSTVICAWQQYVIGLSEVRFTIGLSHPFLRDGFPELYILNNTDETLDVTAKMGINGIVWGQ